MNREAVAVVDPYAAGALLGPEFERRGFACVGIHSAGDVPATFRSSYTGAGLADELRHHGDRTGLAAILRQRGVRAVVPGCELGVDLAERLAQDLAVPTNDPTSRIARRDKVRMVEAVEASGLRTPAQKSSSHSAELLEWIDERGIWPVVIKPCQGTASEGVHLCHSAHEVSGVLPSILGRRSALGLIHDNVLAQEYVVGAEYAVDTVSRRARHQLTAAWRYGRVDPTSPSVGYESMTLLPGRDGVVEQLFDFVRAALDALGIRNGPAHTEVIHADAGLTFVETGARLCGGVNPRLSRMCSGEGQVELLAESIVDPTAFLAREDAGYRLERTAVLVFLVPRTRGRLTALPRLAEIETLPSFDRMRARARPNVTAPRIIGWVSLVHEDPDVLERDLARIRRLEENGLYRMEPSLESADAGSTGTGDG